MEELMNDKPSAVTSRIKEYVRTHQLSTTASLTVIPYPDLFKIGQKIKNKNPRTTCDIHI